MARRRRTGAISPFGTSMLDVVTCALGATLLVFVMRQAVAGGRQAAIARDAEHLGAVEGAMLSRVELLREAVDERRLEHAYRAATSPFGVPTVTGDLCIVLDGSGSMDTRGEPGRIAPKPAAAVRMVDAVLRSNPDVRNIRVTRFTAAAGTSSAVTQLVPWTELPADPSRRIDEIRRIVRIVRSEMTDCRGATDMVSAIGDAMRITLPGAETLTVMLFSDGQHQIGGRPLPASETARLIAAELGDGLPVPIERTTLHCVGLFDRVGTGDPPPFAAVLAYSNFYGSYFGRPQRDLGRVDDFAAFLDRSGLTRDEAIEMIERGASVEIGRLLRTLSDAAGGRFIGVHVDIGMGVDPDAALVGIGDGP